MANESTFMAGATNDYAYHWLNWDEDYSTASCAFGYYKADVERSEEGAMRFLNVTIPKDTSVNLAKLMFRIDNHEGGGVKFKVYGIDEDNTANFSSYPFNRAKTTASTSVEWGSPSSGSWAEIDVQGIVNEIVSRASWSSGNAMGFFFSDNGTSTSQTNDVWDNKGQGLDSYLVIRTSAEPDFTPTPITVDAPTFPTTGNQGIKIAKPGISVLEATEDQLYFTTRKKVFKVKQEGSTITTEMTISIPHGLSYKPAFLTYVKDSEKGFYRYKLPRITYYEDPENDVTGYVQSQSSNIVVTTFNALLHEAEVYYYIFIDPLEE